MSIVEKELLLPDGSRVVLYAWDMRPTLWHQQRNIECFDASGRPRWRVGEYPAGGNSTFTNIYLGEEGELLAYNFDGGEYGIDANDGRCTPLRLLK